MKWWTKALLSCSKFAMLLGVILPNHTLVAPFSIVWKALHITSFGVICKSIRVLNVSMWSKGSLEPSNDSSWGRWNFGGRGWFNTSVVNGESILQIIPSRFSIALSFIAWLSLSISLLMLRSSFSTLDEFSFNVLILLLIWLSNSSSLLFPSILRGCSSSFWFLVVRCLFPFWDLAALRSSSFWRVNSSTLATRAWIYCVAYSESILCYEGLFCHLGKIAWIIGISHRWRQTDVARNQQLSS